MDETCLNSKSKKKKINFNITLKSFVFYLSDQQIILSKDMNEFIYRRIKNKISGEKQIYIRINNDAC